MGNQKTKMQTGKTEAQPSEAGSTDSCNIQDLSAQIAGLVNQVQAAQKINEIRIADFEIKSSESLDKLVAAMHELINKHQAFAEARRQKHMIERTVYAG